MLKALADETRWRIVQVLLAGPSTVGELAEKLEVSPYNASKHVRIPREARIVATEKEGKTVECRVADELRKKLSNNKMALDLGCCTLRFDQAKRGSK